MIYSEELVPNKITVQDIKDSLDYIAKRVGNNIVFTPLKIDKYGGYVYRLSFKFRGRKVYGTISFSKYLSSSNIRKDTSYKISSLKLAISKVKDIPEEIWNNLVYLDVPQEEITQEIVDQYPETTFVIPRLTVDRLNTICNELYVNQKDLAYLQHLNTGLFVRPLVRYPKLNEFVKVDSSEYYVIENLAGKFTILNRQTGYIVTDEILKSKVTAKAKIAGLL